MVHRIDVDSTSIWLWDGSFTSNGFTSKAKKRPLFYIQNFTSKNNAFYLQIIYLQTIYLQTYYLQIFYLQTLT